jgi:hypothetical protein
MTAVTDKTTTPSKWPAFKRKVKKILYILLIVFFVFIGFYMHWKYYYTYSDGYRSGVLQKFSRKGYVFKTYEGEIILSNMQGNAGGIIVPEIFEFSVIEKKIAQQLDTLQGRKVIVHYLQKNGILLWRGESDYLVDSVKWLR